MQLPFPLLGAHSLVFLWVPSSLWNGGSALLCSTVACGSFISRDTRCCWTFCNVCRTVNCSSFGRLFFFISTLGPTRRLRYYHNTMNNTVNTNWSLMHTHYSLEVRVQKGLWSPNLKWERPRGEHWPLETRDASIRGPVTDHNHGKKDRPISCFNSSHFCLLTTRFQFHLCCFVVNIAVTEYCGIAVSRRSRFRMPQRLLQAQFH